MAENNSKSASKLTFSSGTIGEPSHTMTSETTMVVVGRVVKQDHDIMIEVVNMRISIPPIGIVQNHLRRTCITEEKKTVRRGPIGTASLTVAA